MKKIAIIQSNYIPWRGYFDFIDDVDLFVFLDDVQYTRRDWRNRNQIKTPNGLIWLTVPVIFSRNNADTKIENVQVDYSQNWTKKHIESIRTSYCRAPFYKDYADEFFDILNKRYETISKLNVNICKWIMQQLDIKTETKMSSEFNPSGTKTDRLIDILKKAGATSYLSGPAAQNYLEVEKFRDAGISIEYKVYEYAEYPQMHGKFEPHVSVIDLIFNCGRESRRFLKSKRQVKKWK
jgi:hypothetical protein